MHVSLHRLHDAMTERGWGEPAPDGQRMIELPGLYSGRFDMTVFENTSKRRKTSHQNHEPVSRVDNVDNTHTWSDLGANCRSIQTDTATPAQVALTATANGEGKARRGRCIACPAASTQTCIPSRSHGCQHARRPTNRRRWRSSACKNTPRSYSLTWRYLLRKPVPKGFTVQEGNLHAPVHGVRAQMKSAAIGYPAPITPGIFELLGESREEAIV
jgi:hypothetical protein